MATPKPLSLGPSYRPRGGLVLDGRLHQAGSTALSGLLMGVFTVVLGMILRVVSDLRTRLGFVTLAQAL